ncbi:MAG: glycosyltransferase family 4 protein [Methanobacteriaceae archaeon]|jgi:glycosyltransferase involved in cell wall biosynthesis|nr:glycosyltransferase family 4 protein [Methanobacteriaceae archaeon]
MKIAFIYDAVYPWIKGGAEKRIYQLAKGLADKGHEVHWYGVGWWWPESGKKDMEMDGIKLHGVCKPMELYGDDKRSIKEAIYFALMILFKLRAGRYDIIDCQGFPFFSCFTVGFNSFFGRSTLVLTLHEVWNDYWYEYLGKAGFFGKLTEKLMVRLTDKIITVSDKTKDDLRKIKSSEKAVVIPNGIDLAEINQIKPSPAKSDIIFVGRLIKEKKADLLIKSLVRIKDNFPDVKCTIIGEGPEKENLEKLSDQSGLKDDVSFTGFLEDYQDVIAHMKSSKVLVLPSVREGFGMVVLEANACGLPVVVVDHPMNAAKDLIIPGENGFIAEVSENSLAGKIVEAIESREKMIESSKYFAKDYDWNNIITRLEVTYGEFLLK